MNPHRGDVELPVGGKLYTLRYGHASIYALERKTGKSIMQIMREMDNADEMRIGNVIELLWAGLQKHHPEITMDDVCDLLDQVEGGSMSVVGIIGDAFQKAFNAPGTKGTNPPQKAGNGTGTSYSSSTPVSDTNPTPSGT